MEKLDGTEWDVIIVGTGIQQSLLALALSRSNKKILHLDKNDFYGSSEAAFSLQEAEEWANRDDDEASAGGFSHISILQPEVSGAKLSFSRAYSLALAPQLIYTRSSLLQALVSSKVYRQLEFLAVGTWWVYSSSTEEATTQDVIPDETVATPRRGRLLKVPNGREDIFQDQVLDFKAKRALMKFLRFIAEYEEQTELWVEHRQEPFPAFLVNQFKVPASLHPPLLALVLSNEAPSQVTTEYALPRIARHLRSIGVFGAGFGAVVSKWGGLSEITQVACRACAVGGGVYVLGKGLSNAESSQDAGADMRGIKLQLQGGEQVTTTWLIDEGSHEPSSGSLSRSISIVFPSLSPLFPPIADEAPPPACAVVVFPSGSLTLDVSSDSPDQTELPPVYIVIHSEDTGECPRNQNVLYASASLTGHRGKQLIDKAVSTLLSVVDVLPTPSVLWSVRYQQQSSHSANTLTLAHNDNVLHFPPTSLDLAFDDAILEHVKAIWQKVKGNDEEEFLTFQDREADIDDD